MDNSVSILSLIVAVAAVIVGPMISLRIANRQIRSSLRIANKQIVAPMRQSWIASLRDLIAELTSTAMLYYLAGFEERTEDEYRRLIRLEYQVQLMLNP